MEFARFPDWLIYLAASGAIVFGASSRREHADSPEPPPAPPGAESVPLGPDNPFDPISVLSTSATPNRPRGTAFAIADGGVWLTARSVTQGCDRLALKVAEGRAVAARVQPGGDPNLSLLSTPGGPAPLPVASEQSGPTATQAFALGFPRGAPGEVSSRLMTTAEWSDHQRGAPATQALVWAENGRTRGMDGALPGLVGAPALDDAGRVIGMVLAHDNKRARLNTTGPAGLALALTAASALPTRAQPSEPLTVENYGRIADDLRRSGQIAQVLCLRG